MIGIDMTARISDGSTAYVDADWLSEGFRSASALVVPETSSAVQDRDRMAGLAMLAVALRALDEVAGVSPNRVEVMGSGFVAGALRRLLGSAIGSAGRPEAIIDATGDPERLLDATRRLADLGLLVLAGEPGERALRLDLYTDVHVRGLRLVGVPPSRPDAVPAEVPRAAVDYLESEPPATARADEPLPAATWYRLS